MAIRELAAICEKHDRISLKLNWGLLERRSGDITNDLLYYRDGCLVGFIGIYTFISAEAELSGMVHPDYRRQGIFKELAVLAEELCRNRGALHAIYICPRLSESGRGFLSIRDIPYSFSEFVMERDDTVSILAQGGFQPAVALRQAAEADLPLLSELIQLGFGIAEEDAFRLAERGLFADGLAYIGEMDGRAVGKLNVKLKKDSAFILGFCVRPEARGRGYGKALLAGVLERLRRERKLSRYVLEVAADNDRALSLYESCGFRTVQTIDYYKLSLQ
jgi:ribosomal protein S18 acetylase RimI-like enzyme